MKISGLTIIKDGVKFDYPFAEAIKSALPICDEFIVVVGKSDDETRARVEEIQSDKVRIIDTVWDDKLREGGKILAQQTNVGLDECTGDWIVYLQGDEMMHEKDFEGFKAEMKLTLNDEKIEGLLSPYHHFWGYNHTVVTRRTYRREIRVVKNLPNLRSYKDAQGFRMYSSKTAQDEGEKGRKLRVKLIKQRIYAYSRVRPPKLEMEKSKNLERFWHNDDYVDKKYESVEVFNYDAIDFVQPFIEIGGHPKVMHERVKNASWKFEFGEPKFSAKSKFLYWLEQKTGWRVGEYRNYNIVRKTK